MALQRSWGSQLQDFKVGGGKKRAGPDIATRLQKKQKTGSNPRPTLAPELDELNQFVETVAAEEEVKNPDTSFVTRVFQPDTDDDPGDPDLDILTDFNDEDSEISDSESLSENGDDGAPFTFQMDPGVIDTLIASVEHAHNAEPMENDLPDDMPEAITENIRRHDIWYMDIIDALFNAALKYGDTTFEQAPFCWHMLQWCKANDHLRPRLVELLLHPLVRGYRCRNAVGQQPTAHHDTLEKIEYFPLSERPKAVPNVLGIYLLHGIRTQSQDPVKDPRYVGQAASMSINASGAVGIRLRGEQHCTSVKSCKCGLKTVKRALHVHNRLSKTDITGIEITVLSLFPYPVPQLGEEALRHFLSILTLAETIDVILLDTMSQLESHQYSLRVGSKEGFAALRPAGVPRRFHEGLNRALPLTQGNNRMKGLSYCASWSPSEVAVFIQAVKEHEHDVYVHGAKGTTCVQFNFLVSQLQLRGLHKTTAEVVTLYRALAGNPNSGFISRQSSRWRSVWAQVYGVKHHLEKSQLVMDPLDSNDLFYHIPRLEDAHKTSYDFRELLKTTGYADFKHSLFRTKFWTVYLPRLLHRDVWEKITETPPERLAAKLSDLPRNVFLRSLAVVLHFARLHALEHYHSIMTSEFVRVPTFKWSDIVQIWHHASAQLIADGIPCNLVFPGGAVRIVVMLTRHGSKIVDPSRSDPLPPWTYGRSSQGSQAGIRANSFDPLNSSDSLGNEDQEIQGLHKVSIRHYEWPSEASRYKTVAASHDLLAVTALNEEKQTPSIIIKVGANYISPCGMAQYRTSTLRILARLMRDHHESQYDGLGGSNSGDSSIWTGLFIELSESLRATSSADLKHRFSWVLELLRTGSLPAQAELASQILQKRLSGSVFLQQTHPYNYKTRCSTRKFLNPDLSPEWTRAFFLANNVLADVERDIQEQMDGHTIKGFCSLYGILITQLWEQAMAEQGHFYPGLALLRPSASSFISRQANEASAAQEARCHGQAATGEATHHRPSSPPSYPTLQGHSGTRRATRWEDSEFHYLKYLMELSIPLKTKLAKFHVRFGDYRTSQSLETQMKLLRRAARAHGDREALPSATAAPQKLSGPPKAPEQVELPLRPVSPEPNPTAVFRQRHTSSRKQSAAFTYLKDEGDAKREHLRSLLSSCNSWHQASRAMKIRFGDKGSTQVFQTIARLESMDTSRLSSRKQIPWTAEEHTFLQSHIPKCATWKEVYDGLEAEYPKGRSMATIRHYITKQKIDISQLSSPKPWTLEEDNNLREFFDSGVPRPQFPTRFQEKFGSGRTHSAIIERTQLLGLLKKEKWSEVELQNVRDYGNLDLHDFCAQFRQKFGLDRTFKALKRQRLLQRPAQPD